MYRNHCRGCFDSLFLFGNKYDAATESTVVADGCIQEFEIAKAKGNLIIPIGSTGYAAKVISDDRQPHQQPPAHVRGAHGERRHDAAERAAAEDEVGIVSGIAIGENADAHHQDEVPGECNGSGIRKHAIVVVMDDVRSTRLGREGVAPRGVRTGKKRGRSV